MVAFVAVLSTAPACLFSLASRCIAGVALSIMISSDLIILIFVRRLIKFKPDDTND